MQDFYLEYKRVGNKFSVKSNLTKTMMRNAREYEEFDLMILSMLLNAVNSKGDAAKRKFKELCEKNGDPLYSANLIYHGISDSTEKDITLAFANLFNDRCEKFLGIKPIK